MRPSQFSRVCLCAAVVAFSGQALAGNISLSGTVVKPDATPLAGVTVRLAQAGLTAITDAQGAWSLTSVPTSIRGVGSAPIANAGNLRLENGRLQVRLDGRDISGRGQGNSIANVSLQTAMQARSQSTTPDTLVYTYNQKVFLLDTISSFNNAGIIRRYDTNMNANITYGYIKDTRDGQQYRTVKIGTQTWLAQNLSYRTDSSYCYKNDTANCATYGRLYKWTKALGLNDSCSVRTCASQVTSEMQGACPDGLHVPSDAEWTKLTDTILADSNAGTLLKYNNYNWYKTSGTDDYGFRAMLGGNRQYEGGTIGATFSAIGFSGFWWVASELIGNFAYYRSMSNDEAFVLSHEINKAYGFSLRCLQNRL